MPTLNPRINVTLSEPSALVLRKLSELTGNSQSRIIGEMLEEALPVLERMVLVLEAAEKAKHIARTSQKSRLQAAQNQVEKQLGLVLEGFDEYTGALLSDAESVSRRGKRQGGQARAARSASARVASSVGTGKQKGGYSRPPSLTGGSGPVDNSSRRGKR